MSLHKGMEAVLSELPEGFQYRITYDQSAKHGRWRIVAVDKQYRDVFGGAGATLDEARDMVHAETSGGSRMPNESTQEKPEFIVTKAVVYGCEMPKTTKRCETNELVKIPVGSIGTIHVEYVDQHGTVICVAEFDDNVWAWVGETACERYVR